MIYPPFKTFMKLVVLYVLLFGTLISRVKTVEPPNDDGWGSGSEQVPSPHTTGMAKKGGVAGMGIARSGRESITDGSLSILENMAGLVRDTFPWVFGEEDTVATKTDANGLYGRETIAEAGMDARSIRQIEDFDVTTKKLVSKLIGKKTQEIDQMYRGGVRGG